MGVKMKRICVIGACGRMGQTVVKEISQLNGFVLSGAVESENCEYLGKYVNGAVISNNIDGAVKNSDIIIDFSTKEGLKNAVECAVRYDKPLVCGVTGLNDDMLLYLKESSTKVPIFYSANMSIAVAVMKKISVIASNLLSDFDIEIFESHHRNKVDSPSGTALMIANAIADSKNLCADNFCFSRSENGKRIDDQIGFSVVRGGSCPGTHTLYLLGDDENLEITHRSNSRSVFAKGALMVSKWLLEKGTVSGFFSMDDYVEELITKV